MRGERDEGASGCDLRQRGHCLGDGCGQGLVVTRPAENVKGLDCGWVTPFKLLSDNIEQIRNAWYRVCLVLDILSTTSTPAPTPPTSNL